MVSTREGNYITIQSYKHNGKIHRTWERNMILKSNENIFIGGVDRTLVTESDGRKWVTREPSIIYFHKHFWFNILAMIRKEGIVYYCNLASPFIIDQEALKYIDYDLDIKVFANGHKKLLDLNEYKKHRELWSYSADIDQILKFNLKVLVHWIDNGLGPFSKKYVDIWYKRYLELKKYR